VLLFNLLNCRRYGLLGLNGCGKSTLLAALGCRELSIPEHMDIYHLTREIEASDMSSLEAVINCDEERVRLEKEAEQLAAQVCFCNVWKFNVNYNLVKDANGCF
jgi:ATPase subunit of ABC transporter with duplicated ATPase domains